jgi:gliding motility-associated protein GldL
MVYAFLPPPGGEMHALLEVLPKLAGGPTGNPALEKMDKMLQDADINPASLGRLSEGFKKFGTTVEKISDASGALAATTEYTNKTKEAAAALDSMKNAYQGATTTIGHFNSAAESTKQFHSQVQVLTKNLGSLNAIYELELQDTNNHLKAMNGFYSNLVQASETMQGSVTDAKKTQEQIALLAKNLGNLNNVYGNMLSAMQGRQA